MLRSMSKLSLNKQDPEMDIEKQDPDMDIENYLSQSNDAEDDIPDLDLTIALPDLDVPVYNKYAADGLKRISKLMTGRLDLLKKRESLKHGMNTGYYASWFNARPRCFLNLDDNDDDDEFIKYWKEFSPAVAKQTAQKVVDYLNRNITYKEAAANKIRADTIRSIGSGDDTAASRKNLTTTSLNLIQIVLRS